MPLRRRHRSPKPPHSARFQSLRVPPERAYPVPVDYPRKTMTDVEGATLLESFIEWLIPQMSPVSSFAAELDEMMIRLGRGVPSGAPLRVLPGRPD